jgi:hypothetical protein
MSRLNTVREYEDKKFIDQAADLVNTTVELLKAGVDNKVILTIIEGKIKDLNEVQAARDAAKENESNEPGI